MQNEPATYTFPSSLPTGDLGLSGTWTIGQQAMTSGPGAQMELGFQAKDVYLVLGGHGTITEQVDGGRSRQITVTGVPGLYTLVHSKALETGNLHLSVSPGVQAYDFTFG